MLMKKIIGYLFLALVATFIVAGCEKKQEPPKAPDAPVAPDMPKEAPKAP